MLWCRAMQQNLWLKKRRQNNATALHEANFAKLARVVPCLAVMDAKDRVIINGRNRLELHVVEVSKYTITFIIKCWIIKITNSYEAFI